MKKIVLFILLSIFICASIFSSEFRSVDTRLRPAVKTLLAFPKAQDVLDEVQANGKRIRVKMHPFTVSTSNAMWSPVRGSIILNSLRKRSEGEIVRSILFEMHNAKNQKKFTHFEQLARKGLIDQASYVREIERIEHTNAMETMALLNEAISKGYYPQTSYWQICPDFEKHFQLQQQVGHSQFIAKMYKGLSPASSRNT